MPTILEKPVPGGDGDGDRIVAEAEFLAHGVDVSDHNVCLGGFERFLHAHRQRLLFELEQDSN